MVRADMGMPAGPLDNGRPGSRPWRKRESPIPVSWRGSPTGTSPVWVALVADAASRERIRL